MYRTIIGLISLFITLWSSYNCKLKTLPVSQIVSHWEFPPLCQELSLPPQPNATLQKATHCLTIHAEEVPTKYYYHRKVVLLAAELSKVLLIQFQFVPHIPLEHSSLFIIAFDHLRCECDIVSSFFDLFRCVDRPSTSSLLLLQSTTSCEHITKITMQIQNWQIQIQNWQIQIQKRLQVYHLQRASSCQRSIFDSQQLVLRLHFLIKGAENYLTIRNI